MGFYDLSKEERLVLVAEMSEIIEKALRKKATSKLATYFSDEDTYIRRNAYLATGRIYRAKPELQPGIVAALKKMLQHDDCRVRQTVVNAAGEVGKTDFTIVQDFFDIGLKDEHHSVRNAVIGSVKKMGEVNPGPVLSWAKNYLHHPDKEIRREICHGIELRGRTHPQDILPLLQALEFDATARVKNTLVHVLGQISYKKGCLEKVLQHLTQWKNEELVVKALHEMIEVHYRYCNFSFYSQAQAIDKVRAKFSKKFPGKFA
ncbi:MAG: HEAT repeat domain-containing protein [Chitinophagaceae bacterium]|nr:HEAT repeat domain-containing protein [Chitinophagaceae bacterium]